MEESEDSKSIRRELDAIRVMGTTLASLDQAEKDRVMTWLIDKWRMERQPKPLTVVQQPPQDR